MPERRSADRGIEARRVNPPRCEVLPSETLARYLTSMIAKRDRVIVEAHLQHCHECWAVLDSTYKLLADQ
jgi:hypothetical protein